MLVLITAIVLGSPCGMSAAYRKHGGAAVPQLTYACAIEHAATQLRDWPPTCEFSTFSTRAAFTKWEDENSSPDAHQRLQTELADMCVYALATDLRFVGDYCKAPVDVEKMFAKFGNWGMERPSYIAFNNVLAQIDQEMLAHIVNDTWYGYKSERSSSTSNFKQTACNYAAAQGISGISAHHCH